MRPLTQLEHITWLDSSTLDVGVCCLIVPNLNEGTRVSAGAAGEGTNDGFGKGGAGPEDRDGAGGVKETATGAAGAGGGGGDGSDRDGCGGGGGSGGGGAYRTWTRTLGKAITEL